MKIKKYKILFTSLLIGIIGISSVSLNNSISATDVTTTAAPGNGDNTMNADVVNANEQSTVQAYSMTALNESTISFSTSGTYPTINENLINGFDVTITGGTGTVELSQTQTGVLRITGGDIVLKDGNFTRTVYLTNTNTTLKNTIINTTSNYGLEINSNVNVTIDQNSLVKVNSGYASSIIVNENRNNINMYIYGTIESNMQGIGVTQGSVVDNLVIEGTMRNEQNFGLVSTVYGGKINYLEFTENSHIITPKGLMVYNQVGTGYIDKVIINGYIEEARVILTNGSSSDYPNIGDIEMNAYVNKLYNGAFYLNGTTRSLLFGKNSYINQEINNYGLVYTNNNSTINQIDFLGTFITSYLIVDSHAATNIGIINLDPIDIQTSDIVQHNALFWLSGNINTLLVNQSVVETETISRAFNLQVSANIKEMKIDKSVIDAEILNTSGHIFSNKNGNKIQSLSLNDTLLFGDFIELNVDNVSYTHIEPQIEISNFRIINNIRYIDVTIPNLENNDNLLAEGIDLMFLRSDYSTFNNFKYNGEVQTIEIPDEITSAENLIITNYAKYNKEDQIAISSKRSQIVELDLSQYGVDGNHVEYMEGSEIEIEEYIEDAQIVGIGEDFDMDIDLSLVDFNIRGEYQSNVTLTYTDGVVVKENYNVIILGEDEEIIDEDNENPEEENQVDKETESGSNENNDQEHQNSQDKDQTSNSNKDNSNKLDNPTKQPVDTSVKTSDTTNATYYISLLVLSFGLIAIRKKLKFNK